MRYIYSLIAAVFCALFASISTAAPITAEYILDIDDCVVFETGLPYVMADDCTGSLTVTTDTDITFGTPDEGQTGNAVLLITSLTYGTSGAQFFNFLEEVVFDQNGNEVPICLTYCFYTDYSAANGVSVSWGANRGLPYSNGQFVNGTGWFDYEDNLYRADGASFGLIANGQIRLAAVPLPATAQLLLLGLFGASRLRHLRQTS